MKPKDFLNQLQNDDIVNAIRAAEQKTSGEIRVFISRHSSEDPVAAARTQFTQLGMDKTQARNGVLIFVAPTVRKFAVIGDIGVHTHCGNEFWEQVAAEMTNRFKKGEFTLGILHAIQKAGALLAKYFPRQSDDKNELSDDIARD